MSVAPATWHYRGMAHITGALSSQAEGSRPAKAGAAPQRAEHLEVSVTGELDLEDRQALRRVAGLTGLSTEMRGVTEGEYRELRLGRGAPIGVWGGGRLARAGNSLHQPSLTPQSP